MYSNAGTMKGLHPRIRLRRGVHPRTAPVSRAEPRAALAQELAVLETGRYQAVSCLFSPCTHDNRAPGSRRGWTREGDSP